MTTATSNDLELPPGYFVDPWYGTQAWLSIPYPRDDDGRRLLLASSLGPQIIDWAEGRREEEDGPGLIHYLTGEPWRFTPGQKRFLILWYAFDPNTGRWLFRSGLKRGAKGTGKDPFAGAWLDGELVGPTHLVQRGGLWVGERHPMPLVQVAANSEAQAKDVLRVANAMLPRRTRDAFAIDCGETRTILKDSGGRHEILTASEKTSEGDPATAIALNESHHMTESSGGHRTAEVARRNVGKSPRELQARLCEFTNAHTPGSDSVAERTFLAWQAQVAGRAKRVDILYDSIEAPPYLDIYTDAGLQEFLEAAYADAPWSDLERLAGEVLDPRTSVADSIRFYGNGLAAREDAWTDPRRFDELARPDVIVHDGEQIAMLLDCSKSTDSTGLVGCRLDDGHIFTLGLWQRPRGDRGKGWLAPRHEVDAAVRAARDRYRLTWFGVDPSPARDDSDESLYWMKLIDEWHRDFRNELLVWATPGQQTGNAVLFDMRLSQRGGAERNRLFTEAAMQTATDIQDGNLTWDGDAGLRLHVHNARRRTNQWGESLGKVTRDSDKLVDLAVCMVGARMGRRIVLNSGALQAAEKVAGKRTGRVIGWG